MRTVSAAVLALAVAYVACAPRSPPEIDPGGGGFPGGGGGTGGPDGGDAGDAGDGGDAGDAGDGGCRDFVGQGFDHCAFNRPGSIAVLNNNCPGVNVYLDGILICTGAVSGTQQAFDGGCTNSVGTTGHCTSTSLPGNIVCPSLGCVIVVCNPDAGPDAGTCP